MFFWSGGRMQRSKARNSIRANGHTRSGMRIAMIGPTICSRSHGGLGHVRTRAVTNVAVVISSARNRLNQSAPRV